MRLVWALLLGCSAETVTTTAVERGAALAADPGFAESRFNAFACTTCHAVTSAPERIMPGAPLAGALRRSSFWGGRFTTPSEAVNECATKFMRAEPLDRTKRKWVDLWAYLESIAEKGPREAQPFETVYAIVDLPRGDEARGKVVWDQACSTCHGAPRTGQGSIGGAAVVPNETVAEHGKDGPSIIRQVVIEKVRHGSYLGFPGVMPPFSKQALSDQQVADVVTYLGLW